MVVEPTRRALLAGCATAAAVTPVAALPLPDLAADKLALQRYAGMLASTALSPRRRRMMDAITRAAAELTRITTTDPDAWTTAHMEQLFVVTSYGQHMRSHASLEARYAACGTVEVAWQMFQKVRIAAGLPA